MIVVVVNGEKKEIDGPISLPELLKALKIRATAIAVALNSEVVPRSEIERKVIRNHDRIEILRPVGGG